MSIAPLLYAHAFLKALKSAKRGEEETLIARFLTLVRKNGDWGRRKEIAAACERLWRREHGRPLALIEFARTPTQELRHRVERLIEGLRSDMQEAVNPSLIAGVRITLNDEEQLDGSLKRILRKLFQA